MLTEKNADVLRNDIQIDRDFECQRLVDTQHHIFSPFLIWANESISHFIEKLIKRKIIWISSLLLIWTNNELKSVLLVNWISYYRTKLRVLLLLQKYWTLFNLLQKSTWYSLLNISLMNVSLFNLLYEYLVINEISKKYKDIIKSINI